VTAGNPYVVSGTGTITSWSHNAGMNAMQTLTMKVFRKVADPATYMVVGHDGPRPIAASTVNTFPASVAVKPGDVLGLNSASPASTGCVFSAPDDSYLFRVGNLADGQSGAFSSNSASRLNVSAVFIPSNLFTLGDAKFNKKKGTATITVDVPNPGELAISGKGVKSAGAAHASATTVNAPGAAQLLIRAKGKKKRKLNETGKVKLNLAITYTPTGGDASTQSTKVKLKKQ
jgi:hypothetical protein